MATASSFSLGLVSLVHGKYPWDQEINVFSSGFQAVSLISAAPMSQRQRGLDGKSQYIHAMALDVCDSVPAFWGALS